MNYTEMVEVLTNFSGKATIVKVKDNTSGEVSYVNAKSIVLAGGPFTNHLNQNSLMK